MKNYIYKIIIATVALIIVFEFTIGRKFDKADEVSHKLLTKEGRKELIISLKNEMAKAAESENYLTEEEGRKESETKQLLKVYRKLFPKQGLLETEKQQLKRLLKNSFQNLEKRKSQNSVMQNVERFQK